VELDHQVELGVPPDDPLLPVPLPPELAVLELLVVCVLPPAVVLVACAGICVCVPLLGLTVWPAVGFPEEALGVVVLVVGFVAVVVACEVASVAEGAGCIWFTSTKPAPAVITTAPTVTSICLRTRSSAVCHLPRGGPGAGSGGNGGRNGLEANILPGSVGGLLFVGCSFIMFGFYSSSVWVYG